MDTQKEHSESSAEPVALINEDGALFWYARNWYPNPDQLYHTLIREINWEQKIGESHGKIYSIPRLMYHMGDEEIGMYAEYGGLRPWHPTMKKLKGLLEECFNCYIDTCLLNYYENGNFYIPAHADRENKGAKNITIGISLGATRDLVFKRNSDGKRIVLDNRSGDLYIMQGTIHKLWKHSVPKRKRVKEGRISATFRQIMPDDYHARKRTLS